MLPSIRSGFSPLPLEAFMIGLLSITEKTFAAAALAIPNVSMYGDAIPKFMLPIMTLKNTFKKASVSLLVYTKLGFSYRDHCASIVSFVRFIIISFFQYKAHTIPKGKCVTAINEEP